MPYEHHVQNICACQRQPSFFFFYIMAALRDSYRTQTNCTTRKSMWFQSFEKKGEKLNTHAIEDQVLTTFQLFSYKEDKPSCFVASFIRLFKGRQGGYFFFRVFPHCLHPSKVLEKGRGSRSVCVGKGQIPASLLVSTNTYKQASSSLCM